MAFDDLKNLDVAVWYGLALSVVLAAIWYAFTRPNKMSLSEIPAVRPSWPLGWFKFLLDPLPIIQRGYDQFKGFGLPYKIPMLGMGTWCVIVTDDKILDELRRVPEEILSFHAGIGDVLQFPYTVGDEVFEDMYQITIVKSQLTHSLGPLFPEIHDELVQAFADEIPVTGHEWIKINATPAIQRIISRTSNRLFVGLPLCRDPEWRDLNINFTLDVAIAAWVINLFPEFLKPLAGRIFTGRRRALRTALKHLEPLIKERRSLPRDERPNDFLTWMIDEAPPSKYGTIEAMTMRMLIINFGAIHTSSMSLTHALYTLAAHPEYIQPLREEVENTVQRYGWSKVAMAKMRKLDSFMKESQRVHGLEALSTMRKALHDYTFMDGTVIPKGTFVASAQYSIHLDDRNYENAQEFDGFRFANIRDEEGEGAKHQLVATAPGYLAFGHGQHACPGRFFAANEIKCAMAWLVVNYDVKFENEGVRPPDEWFRFACVPNRSAEVMFRLRQV